MFDLVCQNFHRNIHTGLQYGYFLLNHKDLESKTILHKNLCNMHIAHRNMHIAIESILRLTCVLVSCDSPSVTIGGPALYTKSGQNPSIGDK